MSYSDTLVLIISDDGTSINTERKCIRGNLEGKKSAESIAFRDVTNCFGIKRIVKLSPFRTKRIDFHAEFMGQSKIIGAFSP